ncbi:MAG TPA: hypothetical protein VKB89_26240 [Xanthobacteraceae bacterium]|nr:hypothetical protein [Xanthobacteraceae bacterium]
MKRVAFICAEVRHTPLAVIANTSLAATTVAGWLSLRADRR